MTDLVELGFRADSSQIVTATKRMDTMTAAGGRLDRQNSLLTKSLGALGAAMLSVSAVKSGAGTIIEFDSAMKGLEATTRASTSTMAEFEGQARSLGATSKFSATEAANAQRFLAMAGFQTNEILKATPSVLNLATAAEIDLASAADMASNALGGLQLPVEQLDRVIDVMAETAASANTNVSQLSSALQNSAPIATAAGVELEELSAIIGSLSDSGIQAEKAGTGVLGIIRQISNITPQAEEVLLSYGVSLDDMSIRANGLTSVLGTLGKAAISEGDAIKIFGSEAAAAGLIAAASADKIAAMTKRYQEAEGSAKEMADIIGGSLKSSTLALNSALDELVLKIGDAGATDALASSLGSMTEVIRSAGENLEALTDAGVAFASVYGGAMVIAAGKSVSATYADITAKANQAIAQKKTAAGVAELVALKTQETLTTAKTTAAIQAESVARLKSSVQAFEAEIALEKTRMAAQVTEQGRIQSGLRMAEINSAVAVTSGKLAAAETALANATGRVTLAETAATVAKTKSAQANTALTATGMAAAGAATALGTATRFMLGPWGLAITALGAAYWAFSDTSDAMSVSTDEAIKNAKAVSELERVYAAWSQSRLESERNKILERSNEILFERLDIENQIANLSDNAVIQVGMENVANPEILKQIEELESSLSGLDDESDKLDKSLQPVLDALNNLIKPAKDAADGIDGLGGNDAVIQSYERMIQALEDERQQLSLSADAYEIYSVKRKAIENNWSEYQTKEIIKQTEALQDQRKELELFAGFEETIQVPEFVSNSSGSLFADTIANLDAEIDAIRMGVDAYEIEMARLQAIEDGITDPKQLDAIIAKVKELQDVRNEAGEVESRENEYDSLIKSVDDFGDSWTRTGNIIADTFGNAADLMTDFSSRMDEITSKQERLNDLRKDHTEGSEKALEIDAALAKLDEESASAKMSALQSTIGLSAQLFEENSKERKALHALEMGFMAVEIAMAAEKAIVSAVGAIANQGSGDPYSAFGRIAAMVGIMGGVLAAGGIAFSGGGSGGSYTAQESGTGTVLGDSSSQSESINNSLDDFTDIQIDQLAELRDISGAMSQLSSGIANLASTLASSLDFNDSGYSGQLGTISSSADSPVMDLVGQLHHSLGGGWLYEAIGDPLMEAIIGGFSSTKKKLVDSGISFVAQSLSEILESGDIEAQMFSVIETTKKKWWGLSKKKSTNTEFDGIDNAITSEIADIFGFIGDSIIGAVESLGYTFDVNEVLGNFVSNLGNVSFTDKTGEEIQEELEAMFSQQADLMAEFILPSLERWQQVGEGAFETLQRVAYEQAIFNDALERTGVSLGNLNLTLQTDIAQSIIDMTGGVEKFAELSNSFFESFYSDAEQFDYLSKSIADVFDSLDVESIGVNIEMPDTREEFRSLVEGVDLTTEAGQELYTVLMQINPAMSEYFDYLEDAAEAQAAYNEQLASDKLTLNIELLNAQGKSEEALALTRQRELEATDESLHSLLNMIYALEDETIAAQELADARNLSIRLMTAQGDSEGVLALQRKMELEAADSATAAVIRMIYALEDAAAAEEAAQAIRDEASGLNIRLLEAQGDSEAVLALNRQAELASVDESNRAILEMIHALEDAASAEAERSAEIEAAQALADSRVNMQIQLLEAQGRSEEALALTRQIALENLDPGLRALQMQIYAEQDLASAREEVIASLENQVSDLESQQSTLESYADTMSNLSSSLNDMIYGAYDAIENGSNTLNSILSQARTGDFSNSSDIDLNVGEIGDYSSIGDYNFAFDVAANKIAEIAQLSQSAEDVTERAIVTIDNNVINLVSEIKKQTEQSKATSEEMKAALQQANKLNAQSAKTLRRIEQNTYEAIE